MAECRTNKGTVEKNMIVFNKKEFTYDIARRVE